MSKLPGQDLYCDTNSIIHRLDARFKILASLVLMIVILNASTPLSLLLCVVSLGVLLALTRISVGSIARAVLPLVFFVVVSALLNLYANQAGNVVFTWNFIRITDDGIHASLFFGCRMIVLLLSASIIPLSTSTLDISDATERLMMPLARFKVPAHEIGISLELCCVSCLNWRKSFTTCTLRKSAAAFTCENARASRLCCRCWFPCSQAHCAMPTRCQEQWKHAALRQRMSAAGCIPFTWGNVNLSQRE